MIEADPNAFYGVGLAVESYDLFVDTNPLFAHDRAFYVEVAQAEAGPALELGCGTGRVLLALRQAGIAATGLDLSPEMLRLARTRLDARGWSDVELVCASMAAFELGRLFASVLITCRAFHHLTDPQAQRAALACARRHLPAGGLLVLDLFDPLLRLAGDESPSLPPPREATDPQSGRRYRRSVVGRANDPFRQLVSERLRIERLSNDGEAEQCEESSWALRWLTRQEAAWLLELNGFKPVACYSDFERGPPAYGREQLWLARAC